MEKTPKRYLVTTALPYANGPLHIGHLAGVYVPADIYVRYLRGKGREVLLIGGSDEHGVPIAIRAREEGVSPKEIIDRYHELIKRSFKEFGISFDIYSRTSNPTHYALSQEFFTTLYRKGVFVEQESEQYYDPEAKQFLADRYIVGTCPHCGNEKAYGDQCEKCGTSLNATDLINPKSRLSGAAPQLRTTKHWFLPLEQYQAWLEEWILKDHPEWKPNVYGQCKSWLDLGLHPRAVTRDLDWGVPVPLPNAEGKVLYVWFDAPIGYISATKELTPDWEKFWKDEDTKLVHFIGKDNIVFHCIVFPTMLKAHGDYILPDNVPANEFMNLEGDKISTSGNWAVWLHEYLAEFPGQQDVLRYMLTANMPETKDNDFTWREFQSRNNSELVAVLGNFVNRALVLCHKYFEGKVPSPDTLLEEDRAVLEVVHAQRKLIEEAIESYHFRDALREYMQVARVGNKYLADMEPWKLWGANPARVASIIYVSLQVTAALCVLGRPFLPFSTERLEAMARLPKALWDDDLTGILKPGHELGKAELLFARIEDAAIERQIAKLQAAKQANEAKGNKPNFPPQKGLIDFETFEALDLRVGRILTAERVPKANKLLKFTVDTGIDRRTIVSGVAEHFAPEELVGKQVSVVMNLKPRVIRGVESQGMLIFAQDADGKLVVVAPNREVADGAGIG
ncbi:MAG: methionine--tRNA ligase [Bacteroidia bacterium]|nr:methionine--tRNA ligase [Bacteroidia bacterium]